MTKYRYSDADFAEAIKTSISIRGALIKLGVAPHGGSYKTFNLRLLKLGVDASHFLGEAHLKGKNNTHVKKLSMSDILMPNSSRVLNTSLKQRIIDAGLLKNECSNPKCSIKNDWLGEPIVLHVDHINGDHFDHRIENLRLLCPNCHSQTATYCSKNNGINQPKIRKSEFIAQPDHTCESCGDVLIRGDSKNCRTCYNRNRKLLRNYTQPTKIVWPTIEELLKKLETISHLALAKELGVSDNAIRKHIKKLQ